MNWEAIGAVGELVGAAAVVLTLGYLALQIRQTRLDTRASTFDSILAEWRQHQRETYITYPDNLRVYVEGLKDFDGMTQQDRLRFIYILSQEVLFIENIIRQCNNGNITYEQLEPWVDFFCAHIRTPGGASWWLQTKSVFSPLLRDYIVRHAEKTKERPDFISLMPTMFRSDA